MDVGMLLTRQVGYVVTGMHSTKVARMGDTLHHVRSVIQPLPGFKAAKHMVFAGVYPVDGSDFDDKLMCCRPNKAYYRSAP